MDPISTALIMGAAGAGGAEKLYVEDVFSTWLYTGNNSTQTITNGIDLAGKGGMVWVKARSTTYNNILQDTERGYTSSLKSNTTDAAETISNRVSGFLSDGFTVGSNANVNASAVTYASWTFRKAAKFFDVVTGTADSSGNVSFSHSLGATPGFVIIKSTTSSSDWYCYHMNLGSGQSILLNSVAAAVNQGIGFYSASSTSFTANIGFGGGAVGYVAYLFASGAGGFGDSGNESVITCGYIPASSSGTYFVTLEWEPQYILFKKYSGTGNWFCMDNMRGLNHTNSVYLHPNTTAVEPNLSTSYVIPRATGFDFSTSLDGTGDYIYIAIRRGPMKTPTDATKVFANNAITPSTSTFTTNFPVDFTLYSKRSGNVVGVAQDRLRGYPSVALTSGNYPRLETTATSAESFWYPDNPYMYGADSNTGIKYGTILDSVSSIVHAFRRAPGFFDVVAYTGDGNTSTTTVAHGLTVQPELMIFKNRSAFGGWDTYVPSNASNYYLTLLNNTGAQLAGNISKSNASSSTVLKVGWLSANINGINDSGNNYIAYLFATCPGVSKVGSYTGTGTTLSVDCGFTNGARFVLIKRTDNTGDWYVWDTTRGIVSGNDPYLLLNSIAAEVTNTDYIDPLSSGFQISSTAPAAINANGGTFIYLAIA